MMIIGCAALVTRVLLREQQVLGVECSKGRGFIIPGGKWEKGETFSETVLRELQEETGVVGSQPKLIFGGMSTDGAFVYTFDVTLPRVCNPLIPSKEGTPRWGTWDDLMQSTFAPYYELLKEAHDRYWSDSR